MKTVGRRIVAQCIVREVLGAYFPPPGVNVLLLENLGCSLADVFLSLTAQKYLLLTVCGACQKC